MSCLDVYARKHDCEAYALKTALVQTLEVEPSRGLKVTADFSKNGFPNLGTGFVLNAKLPKSELALSDPMHEFDAGNRRRGSSKMLEAEHRTEPQLDRSVILLDQIVIWHV